MKAKIKVNKEIKHTEVKKFFHCECGGEGLLIVDWLDEFDEHGRVQEFYFSMYDFYNAANPSFKHRIKYAWKHILNGEKWEDQIIFGRKNVKDMISFLQERIDLYEED